MKKYLIVAAVLALPFSAAASYTLDISPTVLDNYDVPIIFSGGCDEEYTLLVTRPSGSYLQSFACGDGTAFIEWSGSGATLTQYYAPFLPVEEGAQHFLVIPYGDYTTCIDGYEDPEVAGAYTACVPFAVNDIIRNTNGGIGALIDTANSGYSATVGESVGGSVSWAGDNLVALIMGTGLALLLALRWWIVAIVVISVLIAVAYQAMKVATEINKPLGINFQGRKSFWADIKKRDRHAARMTAAGKRFKW